MFSFVLKTVMKTLSFVRDLMFQSLLTTARPNQIICIIDTNSIIVENSSKHKNIYFTKNGKIRGSDGAEENCPDPKINVRLVKCPLMTC